MRQHLRRLYELSLAQENLVVASPSPSLLKFCLFWVGEGEERPKKGDPSFPEGSSLVQASPDPAIWEWDLLERQRLGEEQERCLARLCC